MAAAATSPVNFVWTQDDTPQYEFSFVLTYASGSLNEINITTTMQTPQNSSAKGAPVTITQLLDISTANPTQGGLSLTINNVTINGSFLWVNSQQANVTPIVSFTGTIVTPNVERVIFNNIVISWAPLS